MDLIGFGELMLRMTPVDGANLEMMPVLKPTLAGAEANLCIGLSRFGHTTGMVSAVADNDLGHAAVTELRRWGVDTRHILKSPGRMGLYFLNPGAIHRPSEIIYDRKHSVFANSAFGGLNWAEILKGAAWVHVSGVTAALGGEAYGAALSALRSARQLGVKVSYDGNFRPSLWTGREAEAPGLIRALMDEADLIFGNHRDFEMVLGQSFAAAEGMAREAMAAHAAFESFAHLKMLASTSREQVSADHNRLIGRWFDRKMKVESPVYDIPGIVDRIGGGDAFAAGVLHGILRRETPERIVALGMASTCLKHACFGDYALSRHEDLEDFLSSSGHDVRR